MQWCVSFPKQEEILVLRPSLKRACGGNKAAAAFLSYLLYQVSISQQYTKNAERINQRKAAHGEPADQLVTIHIYRRQQDIVKEMDEEISDRTLRDTAIPLLVALGYLEIDESDKINVYMVHLDAVQVGIDHPPAETELFLLLQRQADAGTFSARYRKYFRRLAESFPSTGGKSSDDSGKISASKTGTRRSSQADGNWVGAGPKNQKRKRESEEAAEEHALPPLSEAAPDAAAAACFQPQSLSLEEIALVVSHRDMLQQQAEESHTIQPVPESDASSGDKSQSPDALGDLVRTPLAVLSETADLRAQPATNDERPPAVFETRDENVSSSQDVMPTDRDTRAMNAEAGVSKGAPLSAAILVALVEKRLGRRYTTPERQRQLAAAQTLLELKPSLDLATFERVYDACNDDWWNQHYGELHLSHLVEREKSGTVRFLRLLARLAIHSPGHHATVTPTPEQVRGERPLVGISGRPLYIPSGPPMKVLPPPPRERRRPSLASVGQGV